MDKAQKEKELASLKDKLTRAKQIMIADHTGINVADLTLLRRRIKEAKGEFRVSKNTLLKLAVKDTELTTLEEYFSGPTAVVFGYDDPALPAKIIYDSIKETEKPKFKAYYYEGRVYGLEILKKIAEMPPREVVIAGLIGSIQGPIVQFIMVVEAAAREFVATLEAVAKNKAE